MKINLNQWCLVRERPRGVDLFDAWHQAHGLEPALYRQQAMQRDGRLRMQLWEIVHIYGAAMYDGRDFAIETDIELLG